MVGVVEVIVVPDNGLTMMGAAVGSRSIVMVTGTEGRLTLPAPSVAVAVITFAPVDNAALAVQSNRPNPLVVTLQMTAPLA